VLAASLDSLNTGTLNADTTLLQLAGTLSAAVAGSTRDILAQADIDGKRKAFQAVSDGLFDLLRVVQYKGGPVYQQFCPMAFDNAGAAWLSNSKEVINPYFGDKMLHCGELKDSLRF
jgi:Cu(I)/Ag(I) efflux system membrane fusion protein